jgi:type VI secretion system secreted protein Hcp
MPETETYFLKLDGIPGDSKDSDYAGWIDVKSFTVRSSTSGLGSGSSGGGPGKAEFDVYSFASLPGRHSPLLQQASHTGWYIRSGVLEIVRGTGCTRSVSLRVRFTDVLISMYQVFEDVPRDEFSLSYTGIRYESGTPPGAAQTVQPVTGQLIWPAATRRALRK